MIFTSVFGIVTLVLLARALGFAKAPTLDEADAMRVARDQLPGFRPAAAELAPHGRGALVHGRDGRTVEVRPHGDRWVVRLRAEHAVRARA